MIIAGNSQYNLAKEIQKLYPDAYFCSRRSGYNLLEKNDKNKFAEEALNHNHIILISALEDFHQIILYDTLYKKCIENQHRPHIITVGSTIDRLSNGNGRIYSTEKKALLEHSRNLNLKNNVTYGPKTTHISIGMLDNMQEKFPDRPCLKTSEVASYISWIINQPANININEISIDPLHDIYWKKN